MLWFAALLAVNVHADDATAVFAQVSPSIVTVVGLDERGQVDSQGSGVVYAAERVATNCHVVRDAGEIRVKLGADERKAVWRLADPTRDLCVLEVAGLKAPSVPLRAHDDLTAGTRVFAVGNPLGFGIAVSEGLVATLTRGVDARIYFTAALSPGSSGGGLFDQQGRLLGLTTAVLSAGQNFNLALPAQWLRELDTRGVAAPLKAVDPGAEPRWLEEGDALVAKGDWAGAERWCRRWIAAHPHSAHAKASLALSLLQLDRAGEALKLAEDAISDDPRFAAAHSYRALVLHALKRDPEAEDALQAALRLNPDDGHPSRIMAIWRFDAGRAEDARVAILDALRRTREDPENWKVYTRILERLGKIEDAMHAVETAQRMKPDDPAVLAELARLSAVSGKAAEARVMLGKQALMKSEAGVAGWLALGVAEESRQRLGDAESAYRKALELQPDAIDAKRGLVRVLAGSGRIAEAEQLFAQTPALQRDTAALLVLVDIRSARGELDAANEALTRALAQSPNSLDAWRRKATHLAARRDFRGAAQAAEHVVGLPGSNAEDRVTFGQNLRLAGELDRALVVLEQVEQIDSRNWRATSEAGVVLGLKGDGNAALGAFDRSLAVNGGVASTWSNKGFLLIKLNRLPEAVSALETAVRLDPDFSTAWINLGNAYMRQGQLGKGIQALEHALKIVPAALDARRLLLEGYLRVGEHGKARALADQTLSLASDFPSALYVVSFDELRSGRTESALAAYNRLRKSSPAMAKQLRAGLLSRGMEGARLFPE